MEATSPTELKTQSKFQTKFKEGDSCFCDFEKCVVKRINAYDGNITEVKFRHATLNGDVTDRCFEIDVLTTHISNFVYEWSEKIHQLNFLSLNHPDIHRILIRKWIDMCNDRYEKKKLKSHYDSVKDICNKIINAVEQIRILEVEGVNIFKIQHKLVPEP